MPSTRYQIRIDPWWRPLLLVGGATRDNAYVEVSDGEVRVRFGWWFGRTIKREEIEDATMTGWPVWLGVGWRTNLRGLVGLIGSYQNIVELTLRSPMRVWGVVNCKRLAVSLEEPQEFLGALGARAPAAAV